MHINLFEILRRNKSLVIALLAIVCIFYIPVPTPTISLEENPHDDTALSLSKETPLDINLENIPRSSSAITFWTGDTIKASDTTIIEIQVEDTEIQRVPVANLITEGRKVTLQLPKRTNNSLAIRLTAPSLESKKALLFRTQQDDTNTLAYTVYEPKPIITAILDSLYSQKGTADDIEYVWAEGKVILDGESPYAKAETGSKKITKYAIYFPLSYIVSAAIQKMGFEEFEPWLNVVRPLVFVSQLITALTILLFLYIKKQLTLGIFSFFIIILHRFTLYPARVTHIDFPAIAFLIVGLILLSKKPKTAYILIGISLAIKQMAIFIIPLILIWAWHRYATKKQVALACVLVALVPLVTLVPFLIDNPSGTINSIFYSANRASTGDFSSPDISSLLSLEGLTARIPMLGLMGLVFIAFWKKELGIFGACLAIFTVFIGFNPALFFQYLAWLIPLIALAIAENNENTPLRTNIDNYK